MSEIAGLVIYQFCGLTLVGLGLVIWLLRNMNSMDVQMRQQTKESDYHPFRSLKAKQIYLKSYDAWENEFWPIESQIREVDTSYGSTFVRISGPLNAKPLIMLPGGGGTSLMWFRNIEALSSHYRVFALDNIWDNGRSVFIQKMTGIADLIDWLDELSVKLEIEEAFNLMGQSFGAWIAIKYALQFPNKVNRLVLTSPAAAVQSVRLGFWIRSFACMLHPAYFTRKLMNWLFYDLLTRDPEGDRIVDNIVEQMVLGMKSFKLKRPILPTILSEDELSRLHTPTLILMGQNEKIYSPQKASERIVNLSKCIESKVIDNAGHDVVFTKANMVNELIISFLSVDCRKDQ